MRMAPPGVSKKGQCLRILGGGRWPSLPGLLSVPQGFDSSLLSLHCAFVIIVTERSHCAGLSEPRRCDYITGADFQETSPGNSLERGVQAKAPRCDADAGAAFPDPPLLPGGGALTIPPPPPPATSWAGLGSDVCRSKSTR